MIRANHVLSPRIAFLYFFGVLLKFVTKLQDNQEGCPLKLNYKTPVEVYFGSNNQRKSSILDMANNVLIKRSTLENLKVERKTNPFIRKDPLCPIYRKEIELVEVAFLTSKEEKIEVHKPP